jgi:PAS domain S-box-containing protein
MPAEEASRLASVFQEFIARRKRFVRLKNVRRCKDGCLAIVETSGVPVYDEEGRFRGYHGIDHDITERRSPEQKVYSLLESAPDAIVISD